MLAQYEYLFRSILNAKLPKRKVCFLSINENSLWDTYNISIVLTLDGTPSLTISIVI